MPEKQNNESEFPESSRVSFLKVFLIFSPHVGILIAIILCIALFLKISDIAEISKNNSEAINGVILQQSDLSETVYDLTEQIVQLESQIEDLKLKTQDLESVSAKAHPEMLSDRNPDEWPRVVYLTFDDGPSPNTSAILDILKQYDVKATFFTVGKEADSYKDLYRRIVSEGHTLGMHSYSHIYKEIYASKDAFSKDFNKIYEYLTEVTGTPPKYYRFPGGSNNHQIGRKFDDFCDVLNEYDVVYFDWNISTGDATNPPLEAEKIVDNALKGIDKYEEVIILMHDLGNKDTTVEALPKIIENLRDRDIPIKPISESTELIQYH